jgi:hypothetical protein
MHLPGPSSSDVEGLPSDENLLCSMSFCDTTFGGLGAKTHDQVTVSARDSSNKCPIHQQ